MKNIQQAIITTIVLIFSFNIVLNTFSQQALTKDEARFDFDKNGELKHFRKGFHDKSYED